MKVINSFKAFPPSLRVLYLQIVAMALSMVFSGLSIAAVLIFNALGAAGPESEESPSLPPPLFVVAAGVVVPGGSGAPSVSYWIALGL